MKQIKLSQGGSALVDDEDYERVSLYRWHKASSGYAKTNVGYLQGEPHMIRMHRVVMNAKEDQFIDHINRDKLDNRKVNLRVCTYQQNSFNRPKQTNNTSGYKGVHLFKRTGRYQAQIKKGNKRVHLGYFDTPIEAAKAYNKKALELHGEFAYLNTI